MQENNIYDRAYLERGIITQVMGTRYCLNSFSRSGLSIRDIPAFGGAEYKTGDRVYFFIFDDGTGLILDKF